ncbi:NACHT, LRR and PYD domains-containing protein 12-like [Myxocyprinus asiaticus]|uniref:NACHT, LRR and PYD domains-containing protein 12-like n=1 Tax=Myxocyprinus asiaticus TaxID=70543 RepID=UPI0022237519|nr:NACHT, LRR and PYD domains-containing protein 12-like [Myxocyprinus asiaticus]
MSSVQELLYDTLDDLEEEKLKRFKSLLRQNGHIRAAQLEKADATDTVDIMVDCFGSEGAVKITLKILKKINQNQLAEELQNKNTEEQQTPSETTEKHTGKEGQCYFQNSIAICLHQLIGMIIRPVFKTFVTYVLFLLTFSYLHCTEDLGLQKFLKNHKLNMKEEAEHIFEGKKENEAHLKDVYTELFITEGDIKEVNEEHEILKIDDALKTPISEDRPVNCNDIFSLRKNKKKIVLTKGIAGIGKTVLVHKFILDWAEGIANQDIDCMFLLPFRKINLVKNKEMSFHEFLQVFCPKLKELDKTKLYKSCKLAFIFDGLDESRLLLNFESEMLSSVEERSSVDALFTNLVIGYLLPSALIWVTSRPAAANQIPPEYIGLFTEVRGFTDKQKEEYFRKRIKDETQASKIISHIKTSRSLYIMCYIPVFCWITATVLQEILIKNSAENIDTTLTEMYIHFLLIQMNMKNQKYDGTTKRQRTKLLDSNKTVILKLAKLAFEQLKKKNTMFYEDELEECGIDVSEDNESTGMLTEIFKKEAGLHEMKVFCFVHLSVQEFLAAVHVFLSYMNKNMEELQFFFEELQGAHMNEYLADKNIALHDLLKKAIDKAMQSDKGHLDLFLRFLLGLSLESNQKLLKGLFTHTEYSTESITKTTDHITRRLQTQGISTEASINLLYCLLELNDKSLLNEIQRHLSSDGHPGRFMSPSMCSLLTCVLLMLGDMLDEVNMKMYNTSWQGYQRLVPAVRCCRNALFDSCRLTDSCCESVAFALQLPNSPLRVLDMSNNNLKDAGVKLLSDGLKNPHCHLEILRLSGCMVTKKGCRYLASALSSNPSHLKELDLSYNHPGESGVKLLSARLNDQHCRLEKLNVDHGGKIRITEGPQKWACDLTLDPNTVYPKLSLSDDNRKVTRVGEEQSYACHPERFDCCPQVLCKESLSGCCYWEAEYSGWGAEISVSYKGIKRKGLSDDCEFGRNEKSWSLICSNYRVTFCHNNQSTEISLPEQRSKRVGVYLDCPGGTLTFYNISDKLGLRRMKTFCLTLTEPLCAGFGVFPGSSVSLCEIKPLCAINNMPPISIPYLNLLQMERSGNASTVSLRSLSDYTERAKASRDLRRITAVL